MTVFEWVEVSVKKRRTKIVEKSSRDGTERKGLNFSNPLPLLHTSFHSLSLSLYASFSLSPYFCSSGEKSLFSLSLACINEKSGDKKVLESPELNQ